MSFVLGMLIFRRLWGCGVVKWVVRWRGLEFREVWVKNINEGVFSIEIIIKVRRKDGSYLEGVVWRKMKRV